MLFLRGSAPSESRRACQTELGLLESRTLTGHVISCSSLFYFFLVCINYVCFFFLFDLNMFFVCFSFMLLFMTNKGGGPTEKGWRPYRKKVRPSRTLAGYLSREIPYLQVFCLFTGLPGNFPYLQVFSLPPGIFPTSRYYLASLPAYEQK